jgi:hypothetical protein
VVAAALGLRLHFVVSATAPDRDPVASCYPRMPIVLGLLILILAATPAAALDLPTVRPGDPAPSGPAYRSDALTLHLRTAPARIAAARIAARGVPRAGVALDRLGLPGLDAVAASLGGARFAPMFAAGARLGPEPALEGFYRVELRAGVDLEEALRRFGSQADVEIAEPIPVLPVSAFPNDSLFSISTWYYQPSRHDVHAPEAWALGLGDTSVVVGILDTGVVPYHPDLGGTIAGLTGQMFVNRAERGGAPGVDDDGNGYVDDVSGWDFVSAATFGPFPAFEDVLDADNDPNDYSGHGTMVAGLVGAITDNLIGASGTAPQVRLLPLRVGWSTSSQPEGIVDMSYVAEAIVYGTAMGAAVLNCSFSTMATAPLQAAVTAATRAGVLVVFASGNGQPHDLALRSDVIAVAATDASDVVASFSDLGPYVDVSAPGVAIVSTSLVHSSPDSIGMRQPAYGILTGTSFSAPIVSGGLALYEARRRALGAPRLSPVNMALRLWDTADDISSINLGTTGYGGGRLDLGRLLLDPPVSHAHPSGSRTNIPNVTIHERAGTRIYWVAVNHTLVCSDGVSGDTLGLATLPGGPGRQLAAADLGAGRGLGLFIGTLNGKMCGLGSDATPLPGWPYSASAFTQFNAGPALGDLDGDGALEVASGSSDGNVWAWRADGMLMSGFPVPTSALGIAGAVALADVDGQPGDEILVAALDGTVHAIRFDGSEPPGWPVSLPAPAPSRALVVARFGASPAILVACGDQLRALRPDGSLRWSVALGGTAAQDPALADFDGGDADAIVVPLTSPNVLAAFDTTGAPLSGRGWPAPLADAPGGPPVIGPIAAGVPRGTLMFAGAGLVAVSDSARALSSFPKSGGAGAAPTLDELDGDGRTEVAAGTGPDSLFYVYDAGASSWSAGAPWPTPRGDFARRGSRVAPLAIPVEDLTPPGAIADLRVDSLGTGAARLAWTAPGGDGAVGRAARYQLDVTAVATAAGRFLVGSVRDDATPPDPAGAPQLYRLTGLTAGASIWVAVRAVDSTGNVGPASNVVHLGSPLGPILPSRPVDLAPRQQPSARPVTWQWRILGSAVAPRAIRIFDVSGRLVRSLPVPPGEEGAREWDGRDAAGRFVPAGLYFARLVSGSVHAQSRVVLLP